MNRQKLFDRFNELGIQTTTYDHQPVFTVQEAAVIFGEYEPFGQCKNLFLKDSKKRFWLVVALFDTTIQLKALSKKIQAPELRFANADLLMHYLGVTPGSVTPYGLINDQEHVVNVVLDAALLSHATLGFHPLSNDATTIISPVDLQKFIQACGNSMMVVDFTVL